jgi:uncharacterized protein
MQLRHVPRSILTACLAAVVLSSTWGTAARAADGERAPVRTPDLNVRKWTWSYKEIKERQIVMQQFDYSCGAAALATIARYYWGDDIGEAHFLDLLPKLNLNEKELKDRIENGLTLTDLRNLANKGGYQATMARVTFRELSQGKVPVVVGIVVKKHEHFAVFRGTDDRRVYLADPIRGQLRVPIEEFLEQWQKNAILIVAKPNTEVKKVNPMGIRMDEFYRGVLNEQLVRKNPLMPTPPLIFPTAP